jgi:hypothetical protein
LSQGAQGGASSCHFGHGETLKNVTVLFLNLEKFPKIFNCHLVQSCDFGIRFSVMQLEQNTSRGFPNLSFNSFTKIANSKKSTSEILKLLLIVPSEKDPVCFF